MQSGYLLVLRESSLLEMHSISPRKTLGKHLENGNMSLVSPYALPEFHFCSFSKTVWLGDVIHLSAFGRHTIILNSFEAAWDLLEKRSSIYSDRMELTTIKDLWVNSLWTTIIYSITLNLLRMGCSWNFGLLPYGDMWRKSRKMFHQEFNSGAVSAYQGVELKYARWALLLFTRCCSVSNV